MEIVVHSFEGMEVLALHGRIDGLTTPGIKRAFEQSAMRGIRLLAADMAQVSYMSSAGLRVILQTHWSMQQIGGRFVLLSLPQTVHEVLRISGMEPHLDIQEDLHTLRSELDLTTAPAQPEVIELEGIRFERLKREGSTGKLFSIGDPSKLYRGAYHRYDVVRLIQSEIRFGAGVAALGDEYGDFHNLFGESVIVDHQFFSYPAVPRPSVDYSFHSGNTSHRINFLHGFGFSGDVCEVLRFDATDAPLSIESLLGAASQLIPDALVGVVLLAVSGGVLGMHLKQSPVLEKNPGEREIFGYDTFADWMAFPIEEEEINKTLVATGVVCHPPASSGTPFRNLFPGEETIHLHGAIFSNGLWSVEPAHFEQELSRVMKEFEVERVLHLLPASRVRSGFLGLIKLEQA